MIVAIALGVAAYLAVRVTQINQLKASLTETLKDAGKIVGTQYQSAAETEKKLSEALKEQEQAALELNKIAIPYNVLLHEVESDRAMHDAVNNRLAGDLRLARD